MVSELSKRDMMVLQVYWQVGKVSGPPGFPKQLADTCLCEGRNWSYAGHGDWAVRANMHVDLDSGEFGRY